MAPRVHNVTDFMSQDQLAVDISNDYLSWSTKKNQKVADWEELRKYIFAVDTTQTTNSKLPWKNKTTIPKICQIRDNLIANYLATLFPKRKWLNWLPNDEDANGKEKRETVVNYMTNVIENPDFKEQITKCVMDYIDYGNAFAMPEWIDETVELDSKVQVGFVGPVPKRISPLDLVFDPTADSFSSTSKIIKSTVSIGAVKKLISKLTNDTNQDEMKDLWNYLKDYRDRCIQSTGDLRVKDEYLKMDGFSSWRDYIQSGTAELLTFYGDIYDREKDELYENYVVVVVDRHKILFKKPNPSFNGRAPIRHVGWRKRQDNLWAMGPLDNLVGMQYRLDHVENLKADLFDLLTFPPLKIKGQVDDFTWGPMAKIYVSDEGDVELLTPDVQALNANIEIQNLQNLMEEMAGAPKEALGFRSPGEKTAYEVQRLENAASRIFQSKISQFEEAFLEPLLNDLLELARRNVTSTSVRVFDSELKFNTFINLSAEDLAGNGRIRPMGARHFADQAMMIQNLNQFYSSAIGADPEIKAHFSTVKTAQMVEDLLNIVEYHTVQPYVRLSEQQEAQRITNAGQEQISMEASTASGLSEDDVDQDQQMMQAMMQAAPGE